MCPLISTCPPIAWRTGDVGVVRMRWRRARFLRFESMVIAPSIKRANPRNKRRPEKNNIVVLPRGIYHHRAG
jgi:hypothetical protein